MAAVAILALLLVGCSRYYDAWVINPCEQPLRIETYGVRASEHPRYPASRSVSVPASSETKIEDAYTWPDHEEWSIKVIGVPELLPEDPDDWDGDTLTVPAHLCGAAYHPPEPSA